MKITLKKKCATKVNTKLLLRKDIIEGDGATVYTRTCNYCEFSNNRSKILESREPKALYPNVYEK